MFLKDSFRKNCSRVLLGAMRSFLQSSNFAMHRRNANLRRINEKHKAGRSKHVVWHYTINELAENNEKKQFMVFSETVSELGKSANI